MKLHLIIFLGFFLITGLHGSSDEECDSGYVCDLRQVQLPQNSGQNLEAVREAVRESCFLAARAYSQDRKKELDVDLEDQRGSCQKSFLRCLGAVMAEDSVETKEAGLELTYWIRKIDATQRSLDSLNQPQQPLDSHRLYLPLNQPGNGHI